MTDETKKPEIPITRIWEGFREINYEPYYQGQIMIEDGIKGSYFKDVTEKYNTYKDANDALYFYLYINDLIGKDGEQQ